MFDKLFKDPAAIARHRSAPYAEERERYLIHLAQEGYAWNTLPATAQDLLWVARKLSIYPDLRANQGRRERVETGLLAPGTQSTMDTKPLHSGRKGMASLSWAAERTSGAAKTVCRPD